MQHEVTLSAEELESMPKNNLGEISWEKGSLILHHLSIQRKQFYIYKFNHFTSSVIVAENSIVCLPRGLSFIISSIWSLKFSSSILKRGQTTEMLQYYCMKTTKGTIHKIIPNLNIKGTSTLYKIQTIFILLKFESASILATYISNACIQQRNKYMYEKTSCNPRQNRQRDWF